MKKCAIWLMLSCLAVIQAHSFVPHHHHEETAPPHRHAADHRSSFEHHLDHVHVNHGPEFDDSHPEVAPHDEASLSNVAPRQATQFVLVLAIPDPIKIVLSLQMGEWEQEVCQAEHPYATGPPGTKSSRAPPASLTA